MVFDKFLHLDKNKDLFLIADKICVNILAGLIKTQFIDVFKRFLAKVRKMNSDWEVVSVLTHVSSLKLPIGL
jgi:hypothetical protein